jgi:hypothetical protein
MNMGLSSMYIMGTKRAMKKKTPTRKKYTMKIKVSKGRKGFDIYETKDGLLPAVDTVDSLKEAIKSAKYFIKRYPRKSYSIVKEQRYVKSIKKVI